MSDLHDDITQTPIGRAPVREPSPSDGGGSDPGPGGSPETGGGGSSGSDGPGPEVKGNVIDAGAMRQQLRDQQLGDTHAMGTVDENESEVPDATPTVTTAPPTTEPPTTESAPTTDETPATDETPTTTEPPTTKDDPDTPDSDPQPPHPSGRSIYTNEPDNWDEQFDSYSDFLEQNPGMHRQKDRLSDEINEDEFMAPVDGDGRPIGQDDDFGFGGLN